jgi:hypothetical protein
LKWAVVATAYTAGFILYVLTPEPIDALVLALYIAVVAASMLMPLREGGASSAAVVYLRLFVVQAILFSISLPLIVLSSVFQSDAKKYEGAALVIFSTFFFVSAPGLRLARLGDYLRRYGLEDLAKRSSFGTRDDHFILDYSIGRWFQHASFALGYAGLLTVYFLGWFLLVGILWLPLSVSLIALAVMISKRLARSLLSPYDPLSIASQIESVYPPGSLRNISPKSIAVPTFFYLILAWSVSPNWWTFLALVIPYSVLVLGLLVLRRSSRTSDRK